MTSASLALRENRALGRRTSRALGAIMTMTRGAVDKFRGQGSPYRSRIWSRLLTACVALTAVASTTTTSLADEDGASFWIPGFFGSLAAVPQQPGWSLTSILYNTNV